MATTRFARTISLTAALAAMLGVTAAAADNDQIQIGEWNHMLVVTAPASDEAPKSVQRQLNQHVTVDFKDEALDQVADFLRSVTNINFVLAPDVLSAPPTITLKVADMPMSSVLHWIGTLGKVDITWRDGAYYLASTATAAPGPVTTTYYDVSDLVMDIPDFPGPDMDIPAGKTGVTPLIPDVPDKPQTTTEDVADLLRKMLHQDQ